MNTSVSTRSLSPLQLSLPLVVSAKLKWEDIVTKKNKIKQYPPKWEDIVQK